MKMRIDRAMLLRIARLFARRAAAAVGDRVAQGHAQEGCAAVAHAALHDAHGATFADRGAGGPIDALGQQAHPSQARGARFGGGFGQGGEGAAAAGEAHSRVIGRIAPIAASAKIAAPVIQITFV
jgi:hypothetical protein